MKNSTEVRVYYSETDHGGAVYYANYLKWFEIGRTELLRQHGFDYATFEKRGLIAPVVDVHCEYKHPALYNDLIAIETSIEKIGNTSITFAYEIKNKETDKLLAKGSTVNVFVDMKTQKPTPLPNELRDSFEK